MPLKCKIGEWDNFIKKYRSNKDQWYLIPKAKTFDERSIEDIIKGLEILDYWFYQTELLPNEEKEILLKYLKEPQQKLFKEKDISIKWGNPAQVFLTTHLFNQKIISRDQQDEYLKNKFDEIIKDVLQAKNYYEIERKYKKTLLITTYAANSRNFINICQKLGLAWIEENHYVTITPIGKKILNERDNYKPFFEHQLRRFQFYNPSFERIKSRYGHIKVFPFHFCLKLILKLKPQTITKEEFALFITKAKSMEDIDKCRLWIDEYRKLEKKERKELFIRLSRPPRGKGRPLFVEALETASKNINFLTIAGPWQRNQKDESQYITITDINKAKEINREDSELEYFEFETKESWFCQYGDLSKKFDVNAAIEYYTKRGKIDKAKIVARKAKDKEKAQNQLRLKIQEKDIEDFYKNNLNYIEAGLSLYKEQERDGQQYETPDGGIIDLLTITPKKEFVVIEFKREESSDETIGQLLRYMGWVKKHLSTNKLVRGYIVAYDFDRYLFYALNGMQHPLMEKEAVSKIIGLYKHGIDIRRAGRVEDIQMD